jgi:hypothetical protein
MQPELARELGTAESAVRMDSGELYALGLVLDGVDEGRPPMLLTAGRQFLARRGDVNHEVLAFLSRTIDGLNAREALLVAGTFLVDEFRIALLRGDSVEHAQQLVPPGFTAAVDERLVLDLFAATVALMARLSDGAPAGCVAEEVISVALMEEARAEDVPLADPLTGRSPLPLSRTEAGVASGSSRALARGAGRRASGSPE